MFKIYNFFFKLAPKIKKNFLTKLFYGEKFAILSCKQRKETLAHISQLTIITLSRKVV